MFSFSNGYQTLSVPTAVADLNTPHLPEFLKQVQVNQVYALIDTILPFEACLYYQVLPLFIEGSRLMVGTVYPDDPAAVQYVQKQLSYINYSIVFKPIPSDWHRDLLSKYLSHAAKQRSASPPETTAETNATEDNAPTPPQKAKKSQRDRNLQQTLIVDQPESLLEEEETVSEQHTHPQSVEVIIPSEPPDDVATPSDAALPIPTVEQPPDSNPVSPLQLHIEAQYRQVSDEELSTLPPNALLHALLDKVLSEGIGRLYFERQSHTGRILWSRDGILQAVVYGLDSRVFQGVINEFKLLTHLPLISITKPRQVEIERLLGQERVLLRFKVMPNAYGEEATLQVLRGTALKFYQQQQQIEKLGRDALDAAQLLQYRLSEIRQRARSSFNSRTTRTETLPAIIKMLKQMESQVAEIVAAYDLDES